MTLLMLQKTIKKWAISAAAAFNHWYMRVTDWSDALITALNFLAGNYQGEILLFPFNCTII